MTLLDLILLYVAGYLAAFLLIKVTVRKYGPSHSLVSVLGVALFSWIMVFVATWALLEEFSEATPDWANS